MNIRFFVVPAFRKDLIEAQLIKLNKRAEKLGIDSISYEWGKAYTERRKVLTQNPKSQVSEPVFVERDILVIPIQIMGPFDVSYSGWDFVATIQHIDNDTNIIRSIEDVQIPTEFRSGSKCDHCNINRYRKDTYILRNEEDNRFIQVGKSCIKDFLGGHSPDRILEKANFISELIHFMNDTSGYERGRPVWSVEEVLSTTYAVIRDHGWTSVKVSQENGRKATKYFVMDNLFGDNRYYPLSIVSDNDIEKAKQAASWAENISDTECESEYLYNLRAIAQSGMVDERLIGYAASICVAYDRIIYPSTPKKESQWVSKVGTRDIFNLELKNEFVFDSNYGTTYVYMFHDENSNVVVWKASSKQNFEKGMKYIVQAYVKDHTLYKDKIKQTLINRGKILSLHRVEEDI
jgi:hypothetical protein